MKNLNRTFYLLLYCVLLLLSSCGETERSHRTEPSVFVVTKAFQRDGMDKMMYYQVELPDRSRLGYTSFVMCDSVNKYKVGDILYLSTH